jgi:hypothetical protein
LLPPKKLAFGLVTKGNFASGRAEDPLLFHKNVAQNATFL